MIEARWWHTDPENPDGNAHCQLCPKECIIPLNRTGFCSIRANEGGRLLTHGYGQPQGFGIDPVEKKPLSHFYPGSRVLSFGTHGCNLSCRFCQNWNISQNRRDSWSHYSLPPEKVIEEAEKNRCQSIAFTYNEPTIFGEYVIDVSRLSHEAGIKTIMVSNGFISPHARNDIYEFIDAANIDLKSIDGDFYTDLTGGRLTPVLETIKWLANKKSVWLELTTLIIPEKNDSPNTIQKLCHWIFNELGSDIPIHFSAFHPDFKMKETLATPPETLFKARQIALDSGLRFIYLGNIRDENSQSTFCPDCKAKVISRNWHTLIENRVINGCCPDCKAPIAGHFNTL